VRICPKCGHIDPIWWRTAAFHPEFSYAQASALESLQPELWELLKDKRPGDIVQVGEYMYWKSTRSDTVRRAWTEDLRLIGKKGSWQEKAHGGQQLKLDRWEVSETGKKTSTPGSS